MKTYSLHFNDGSNSRMGITKDAALWAIADKYNTEITELVIDEQGGERPRILVWLNEADAENDSGENAVAELVA